MNNLEHLGEALTDALKSTPMPLTIKEIDGIPVMTQKTLGGIFFFFNFGGIDIDTLPTEEQATVFLNQLNDFYQSLLDASAIFREYMKDKEFSAQLGVYVERICFPFCSMTNGVFKWEK